MSPSCGSTAGGTLDQNVISALWEEKKHLNLSNNCRSLGKNLTVEASFTFFFLFRREESKLFTEKINSTHERGSSDCVQTFFLASLKKICLKHFARPRIIKQILELNAGPLARAEQLLANFIWELLLYQFTVTFSTRRKSSLADVSAEAFQSGLAHLLPATKKKRKK